MKEKDLKEYIVSLAEEIEEEYNSNEISFQCKDSMLNALSDMFPLLADGLPIQELSERLKNIKRLYKKEDSAEDLISRKVLLKCLESMGRIINAMDIAGFKNIVKFEPAVEATPVIRCKDCGSYNKKYSLCCWFGVQTKENDFCSFAERRD